MFAYITKYTFAREDVLVEIQSFIYTPNQFKILMCINCPAQIRIALIISHRTNNKQVRPFI